MRKFIIAMCILFMTACTPCQVQLWLDSQPQPDAPPAGDTYAGCDDPVNAAMDYCKEMTTTTSITTP